MQSTACDRNCGSAAVVVGKVQEGTEAQVTVLGDTVLRSAYANALESQYLVNFSVSRVWPDGLVIDQALKRLIIKACGPKNDAEVHDRGNVSENAFL